MQDVLFALYLRELKGRLDGRWGSALWVVGEPLANLAAMLLLYSAMRTHSVGGIDTLLFLVSGQLPYLLFKSLVLRLMDAIDANQGLFAYRQVKPLDAVLARAGVELTLFGSVSALCLAGLVWLGHDVWPEHPLEMAGTLTLLVLLGIGLGLLCAVATGGALTRTRGFVRMAFFPIYLASGAIFPLSTLPQGLREWLLLNPLAHLLEVIRSSLFGARYHPMQGVNLDMVVAWILIGTTVALSMYRVRRDHLLPG